MDHLIESLEDIFENLFTIESYLTEGSDSEKEYTIELVKKGRCFVAYKVNGDLKFAPSRFIGYKSNSIEVHEIQKEKGRRDGRDTNPIIDKILDQSHVSNEDLEKEYLKYIEEKLCIKKPTRYKRTYWLLERNGFSEGESFDIALLKKRRNSILAGIAKEKFKLKYGRLFCEVCGFDFQKVYGEIGEDFIEAHHTIPVSEMEEGHLTKIEDLVMLCSNCHSMVHRRRPWLGKDELKSLIK